MKTWTTDENGVEWIGDDQGNRCSVKFWGSKEDAEKALDSLARFYGSNEVALADMKKLAEQETV